MLYYVLTQSLTSPSAVTDRTYMFVIAFGGSEPLGPYRQSQHLAVGQLRSSAGSTGLEMGITFLIEVVQDNIQCGEESVEV